MGMSERMSGRGVPDFAALTTGRSNVNVKKLSHAKVTSVTSVVNAGLLLPHHTLPADVQQHKSLRCPSGFECVFIRRHPCDMHSCNISCWSPSLDGVSDQARWLQWPKSRQELSLSSFASVPLWLLGCCPRAIRLQFITHFLLSPQSVRARTRCELLAMCATFQSITHLT